MYFILICLLFTGCTSTTKGIPIARVPTKITSYPLIDNRGIEHKYRDKVDSFIFPHDNKKLTQFCAFHFHWEDIKAVYRKDEDGKWGYTYIVNKNKKSFKK
jgi:predicted component of type VI protein secretion system